MSEAIPYIAAPFTGGASLLGSKAVGRALTAPAPPGSPPAITTETKAVQDAAADATRRRSRARGHASTILQSFLQGSGQAEGLKSTTGS